MTVALSPYVQGVLTPLAIVGVIVAVWGFVLVASAVLPEITWWTVKKLPLQSPIRRDLSAAVVGGARRAYCLRIPYGVRIIVALGGSREDQEAYADLANQGRIELARRANET